MSAPLPRWGQERKGEERERGEGDWCFKPSKPQRIISGLKETFVKRYIVERTNKAEIRPAKQSQKKKRKLSGELME